MIYGSYAKSPWERLSHYLWKGVSDGCLRLEARLVHVPSGKATMLYSSRHHYPGEAVREVALQNPTQRKTTLEAPVEFLKMCLPPGGCFPWAQGSVNVRLETTGDVTDMADGARFGFDNFSVKLMLGDQPYRQAIPPIFEEVNTNRLLYRTLQALPWTD